MKPTVPERFPVEFLSECFAPDYEAGVLRWRERPRRHFLVDATARAWNAKYAGKVAGARQSEGYVAVTVTYREHRSLLLVHRVLVAMREGRWPESTVDHKNHSRTDNSWSNLRKASYVDQNANRPVRSDSKVGLKGVCVCHTTGRFKAQLHRNGKNHFLGRFDTAEEAHEAYRRAADRIHKEFASW